MKRRSLNVFKGKIKRIVPRSLGADLIVELAPGVEITSRLTAGSFASLNPRRGQTACAVIPALDVTMAPG